MVTTAVDVLIETHGKRETQRLQRMRRKRLCDFSHCGNLTIWL